MSTVPRTAAHTTVLSGTASNMRPTPLRARSTLPRELGLQEHADAGARSELGDRRVERGVAHPAL